MIDVLRMTRVREIPVVEPLPSVIFPLVPRFVSGATPSPVRPLSDQTEKGARRKVSVPSSRNVVADDEGGGRGTCRQRKASPPSRSSLLSLPLWSPRITSKVKSARSH